MRVAKSARASKCVRRVTYVGFRDGRRNIAVGIDGADAAGRIVIGDGDGSGDVGVALTDSAWSSWRIGW